MTNLLQGGVCFGPPRWLPENELSSRPPRRAVGPEESWACGPPEVIKNASVRHPLSMEPLPFPCHPDRTRISCHVALDTAACAAFVKEGSMRCTNATKFHRKSGRAKRSGGTCGSADPSWRCFSTASVAQWWDLRFPPRLMLGFLATRNSAGLKAHNSPLAIPVAINPGITESPTDIPIPILAHQVSLRRHHCRIPVNPYLDVA
jgi:hypothetical protein